MVGGGGFQITYCNIIEQLKHLNALLDVAIDIVFIIVSSLVIITVNTCSISSNITNLCQKINCNHHFLLIRIAHWSMELVFSYD